MASTTIKNSDHAPQQFVFGLENGKPVGARFPASEIRIAAIVKAKGLELHAAYNDEWVALATELPEGRVYNRGKGFIPAIKASLFERLTAWTQQNKSLASKPSTASAHDQKPQPVVFPKTREEIGPGSLVLAEESLDEGFWYAIVVQRTADVLTLRYRDYPKADQIKRTIWSVGLLVERSA
jgi:hypothetical protein